jgi:hypothetical protein
MSVAEEGQRLLCDKHKSADKRRRSEIRRLFGAAQFGDDEEVTRMIREMDRTKRKELIMACEFILQTARMMQRGSYRL